MKMTLAPEEKYRKIKQTKRNVMQRASSMMPRISNPAVRDVI